MFGLNENLFSEAVTLRGNILQGSIHEPHLFFLYVNNLSQSSEADYYFHANGTCILSELGEVLNIANVVNSFFNIPDAIGLQTISCHFILEKIKPSPFSLFFFGKRLNQ